MKIRLNTALFAALMLCASACVAAAGPTQHVVKVGGHPISVWSRIPDHAEHVILLVHGRTWSAVPDFDLQIPGMNRSVMRSLIALGFATYAIDLRGYGSTPRNADGWNTPNEGANDVAEILKWIAQRHPRLGKPVLLGWSMGSLISQLTAQQQPELLSDLILHGYPRDPAAPPANSLSPAEPPREKNTRERASSDFISPQVTAQAVIEAYVAAALKTDPVRADWHALGQYDALDPAKVINPTLVIHGERDPLAPMAAQSHLFLALKNPDKQWVVLPGGDHAAMLEDTHEAFIAAVKAFVARPRLRK